MHNIEQLPPRFRFPHALAEFRYVGTPKHQHEDRNQHACHTQLHIGISNTLGEENAEYGMWHLQVEEVEQDGMAAYERHKDEPGQ